MSRRMEGGSRWQTKGEEQRVGLGFQKYRVLVMCSFTQHKSGKTARESSMEAEAPGGELQAEVLQLRSALQQEEVQV